MTKKTAVKPRPGQRNDEARMRFAEWLTMPVSERKPRTQRELARELGTDNGTLSRWRRHPAVQGVVTEWRESYRKQFAEVMEAMQRQARHGNVAAARLIAEVLGELAAAKSEVNLTEAGKVSYAEPDALRKYAQGVLAETQKQEARHDN